MKQFKFSGYGGLGLRGRHWKHERPAAALLVIHGMGEHSGRYAAMAEYMHEHGISLMSYDLRGHGLSEGKRGLIMSFDELREDARTAVLEISRSYPQTPFFILGHSMGGTILLDFMDGHAAESHTHGMTPLPRGIIVSAPVLGAPGIPPYLMKIAKLLSAFAPRLTMNTRLDSDSLSRDANVCQQYRDDPLVHERACVRLSGELESAQKRIFMGAMKLGTAMLLSYGSQDALVPRAPLERFFAAAGGQDKTFHIFDAAFHELHNDIIRDEVCSLYAEWILKRA